MFVRLSIVLGYLLITFAIGLATRRAASRSSLDFFLAGRGLSPLLLFLTMTATNFSAFTIFGLSGAGYRIGYAFYPVMGFGTGFMALSFLLIGRPIMSLAARRGYITPADFIADRYGSRALKKLFSGVMILFTLPYIAIQAIAGGKSLESLAGVPYLWGAALVTVFIVLYVGLGGLRSIAWTDAVQGLMMLGFTVAAFVLIASRSGGFLAVHREIGASWPGLLRRPGLDGSMLYGVWFGYLFLWFFADPMFPQLFQRFMAAREEKSLRATVVLYPLVTTVLFFLTVSIGVMGRHTFPALAADQTDAVFALLLRRYAGVAVSTLLLTGSLAALMSTMDSQLLTLTSMITMDFVRPKRGEVLLERLTVALLGAVGLLIAARPPQTILAFISGTTFNGLAVLAPTVIGGLYWRRANRYAAAASIVAGEALVAAFYFRLLSVPGVLPVVPIVAAASAVFVLVGLLTRSAGENAAVVARPRWGPWLAVFAALFLLGNDFWAWGRTPVTLAGLPLWIWYYVVLGLLLTLAYAAFLRRRRGQVDGAQS